MHKLVIPAAALVLLLLSGCATGRSGVVLKTDTWDHTVRIGDAVYEVTPYTELIGADGRPIQLHQIPTVSDPGIGVRYAGRATVDFLAWEQGGRLYLERLRVSPR
jgi:hypothetical protein